MTGFLSTQECTGEGCVHPLRPRIRNGGRRLRMGHAQDTHTYSSLFPLLPIHPHILCASWSKVILCSNCGQAAVLPSLDLANMLYCRCGNPVIPATPAQFLAALSRGTTGSHHHYRGASRQVRSCVRVSCFIVCIFTRVGVMFQWVCSSLCRSIDFIAN